MTHMSRVLHIEDDPRNRLLVRKLLAAEGHEVIDAADGLEGVRCALSQRPDLVLVDLNIPGLDGYEVTLRFRSEPSLERGPHRGHHRRGGPRHELRRRVRRLHAEAHRRAELRAR